MTRRDVESFTAAHDAARAAFHLDLDLARQGDALMVVLAGRSTGDRLDMLRPAPTRLVHHAGDVDLAENHPCIVTNGCVTSSSGSSNDLLTMAIAPGYGAHRVSCGSPR